MESLNAECLACVEKTMLKLIEKFNAGEREKVAFAKALQDIVQEFGEKGTPYVAREVQAEARRIFKCNSIYAKEKHQANILLLSELLHWKSMVENARNPFFTAAKLAVLGNIIDYGAHSVPEDIKGFIENGLEGDFAINHSTELREALCNANSVLYLGDNAGEIIFDRIFIETINHPNLTFAYRGADVLNDVTIDDVRQSGIDGLVKTISNGYDAPGTILEKCSPEFQKIFNEADLIISKGQGNFESLMNTNRLNVFFMLMAKCNTIAARLGVNKGDRVIKKNK
jgi:uncharacterized protein with ATP-grasp and redox domains